MKILEIFQISATLLLKCLFKNISGMIDVSSYSWKWFIVLKTWCFLEFQWNRLCDLISSVDHWEHSLLQILKWTTMNFCYHFHLVCQFERKYLEIVSWERSSWVNFLESWILLSRSCQPWWKSGFWKHYFSINGTNSEQPLTTWTYSRKILNCLFLRWTWVLTINKFLSSSSFLFPYNEMRVHNKNLQEKSMYFL
jgi:hypothetical protein